METTGEQGGQIGTRLIKRYANRKLYDTHESRYVTLNQIAVFVREGQDVTIIDNTSKEDLTNVTLAQIIYEEEKKGADENRSVASAGTLKQLIQQSGERLITSFREGPMGKLMARREGEEEDGIAAEISASEETGEDKTADSRKSVFESSKEAFDELQRRADDGMRGFIGNAVTHLQQLQAEVKRLQTRIEDLEERLVGASRRTSAESSAEDEAADAKPTQQVSLAEDKDDAPAA